MPKKKSSLNNVVETNNGIRISYHEKVCAERMKTLFKKIDEMSTDIRELRADTNQKKGAVNILVGVAGVLGAILGYYISNG